MPRTWGPSQLPLVRPPRPIEAGDFDALWRHGSYSEPFLKRGTRFSRRWQSLRFGQLAKEEVRDPAQVQQLDQVHYCLFPRIGGARSMAQSSSWLTSRPAWSRSVINSSWRGWPKATR